MSKKSLDEQSSMEMGNCSNRRPPPQHNAHQQLSRLSAKVQPIGLEHQGCDADTRRYGIEHVEQSIENPVNVKIVLAS